MITQTPSDVQSRRTPALINTCHDARFAPHVGANVTLSTVRARGHERLHGALARAAEGALAGPLAGALASEADVVEGQGCADLGLQELRLSHPSLLLGRRRTLHPNL